MSGVNKQELRAMMKCELSSLSYEQRQSASRKACRLLLTSFPPEHFAALLSYAPLKTETSPLDVAHAFLEHGKTLALPRVNTARHEMDFFALDPRLALEQQVAPGSFGIAEPEGGKPFRLEDVPKGAAVLLVAPGLAFGRDGSRLGRGGGFYDRMIARLRREASLCGVAVVVCGFCFALQLKDSVPIESHDASVDAIASDAGVLILPTTLP